MDTFIIFLLQELSGVPIVSQDDPEDTDDDETLSGDLTTSVPNKDNSDDDEMSSGLPVPDQDLKNTDDGFMLQRLPGVCVVSEHDDSEVFDEDKTPPLPSLVKQHAAKIKCIICAYVSN